MMKTPFTIPIMIRRILIMSIGCWAFFSCQSRKETSVSVNPINIHVQYGCPVDGDCVATIIKNKRISYQKEKSSGGFFPKLKSDSTVNVVKVVFNKNKDKAAVDGEYREEILFDWPKSKQVLKLTNQKLQEINFLYGRFCFCASNTVGYFKVDRGEFLLKKGQILLTVQKLDHIAQKFQKLTLGYELE